ncbi:MAG: flagellar hook protein FlgE [Armatimonadetes bacterium]|nr:flagellar hook protein FlgE [Armatimonadota bacterium]
MPRALYAGLSGTLAHQTAIDVIANNLANMSTVGYKERRTQFSDCFYQTLRAGRGAASGQGLNPMQVGVGVRPASIAVLHTQGAIERTGQPLDAAIEGPGFFVVSDNGTRLLTRDGAFATDDAGHLILASTGARVLGWMADDRGNIETSGEVSEITVPLGWTRPASATTQAAVSGNLDAGAEVGDSVYCSAVVYDSLGLEHPLRLAFTKTDVNEWQVDASCEGSTASTTLVFNSSGTAASGTTISLNVALTNGASTPQTITISLSSLTQRGAASTPAFTSQDGHGTAQLQDVSITNDGIILGTFSDGQTVALAQLALANVPNVGGLQAVGNNMFAVGLASGQMSIGPAGTGNRGRIVPQSIELSTVDVTRNFIELIQAERGFQANTRVISTANRLLEDVLQIIR